MGRNTVAANHHAQTHSLCWRGLERRSTAPRSPAYFSRGRLWIDRAAERGLSPRVVRLGPRVDVATLRGEELC